jgi:hypothetical protein
MGLLRVYVLLLATSAPACYSPEIRDCTLTCNEASDCAGGQVCGSDRFCAAPGIAGTCSSLPGDAASDRRDAGIDAPKITDARVDAPPDASPHAQLTISIEGKGRVTMTGIGSCDAAPPQDGECTYNVSLDSLITVSAQSYEDWYFEKWTTAVCAATPIATCTFWFTEAAPLGVKFKKD